MKTFLKSTLVVIAAVACCAAVSSINKPVTPYNSEQVKGKVRVVLLRVDRTTVFSDEGFQETTPQKIHAIPGLSVVYAVELLGDEPVTHWNTVSNDKLVWVNGKPLADTTPENLAGGGNQASNEYEYYNWRILKKPSVTNPKRTQVHEVWKRGLRVTSGKIDLHFTTGFNDHKEEFVFEGVPLE